MNIRIIYSIIAKTDKNPGTTTCTSDMDLESPPPPSPAPGTVDPVQLDKVQEEELEDVTEVQEDADATEPQNTTDAPPVGLQEDVVDTTATLEDARSRGDVRDTLYTLFLCL